MSEIEAAQKRVERFIHDYEERMTPICAEASSASDVEALSRAFEAAQRVLKEIAKVHCDSEELLTQDAYALGPLPNHSAGLEKIIKTERSSSENVVVETKAGGEIGAYYEYALVSSNGEWRISTVKEFRTGTGEDVRYEPRLQALLENQLPPIPAEDFPIGLDRLFDKPARLKTHQGIVTTRIECVGNLEIRSGRLTCADPGEWQFELSPFEQRVPSGLFPIELLMGGEDGPIVGAAKVTFGKARGKCSFIKATRASKYTLEQPGKFRENSHVIGVDGGTAGLADAGAIDAMSSRERERLWWRSVEANSSKTVRGAAFFSVSSDLQGVVIDSGRGDGGYPAYWVLDENGELVSLLLDFVDLSTCIIEELAVPFSCLVARSPHPGLQNFGLECWLEKEARYRAIRFKDTRIGVNDFNILDANGSELFNSTEGGCSHSHEGRTYYLTENFQENLAHEIRFKLHLGRKYVFDGE